MSTLDAQVQRIKINHAASMAFFAFMVGCVVAYLFAVYPLGMGYNTTAIRIICVMSLIFLIVKAITALIIMKTSAIARSNEQIEVAEDLKDVAEIGFVSAKVLCVLACGVALMSCV